MRRAASRASWIFPTSLETLPPVQKEDVASAMASCLPEVLLHSRASPRPICGKSGPHPAEPHVCGRNRSPERGNGRRPTDACWPGTWLRPPPGRNNSDESGSSWLICNKKLSSENGVGCLWELSMAEWLIPGLQLEKMLESGRRLMQGASQGLFHRNRSKRQIQRTTEHTAVSVFSTFMSDRNPAGLMECKVQNWVEQWRQSYCQMVKGAPWFWSCVMGWAGVEEGRKGPLARLVLLPAV